MHNNITKAVFKNHFKGSFKIALWFFAIYAAVMIVLSLVLTVMSAADNGESGVGFSTILVSFVTASCIFLLVMGISTYSMFTSEFLFQGVTRKNYLKGMLLSAVSLCFLFTLIALAIVLIENAIHQNPYEDLINSGVPESEFAGMGASMLGQVGTVPFLLGNFISFYIYYMLGTMIGMTFYGYGTFKGLISIVCAFILYNLQTNLFSEGLINVLVKTTPIGEMISLLFSFTVTIIITIICYLLNRNVKLKITTT